MLRKGLSEGRDSVIARENWSTNWQGPILQIKVGGKDDAPQGSTPSLDKGYNALPSPEVGWR